MDMHTAPSTPAASSQRLGKRLMALAVLASLLASTCCVLPLVLVLVGIGGAWMSNLVALKPVTPYFIALSVAMLAWAGYLVFRPQAACAVEAGAACETTRPIMRRIFLACALFIALLLLFPLIAPVFY